LISLVSARNTELAVRTKPKLQGPLFCREVDLASTTSNVVTAGG
jgi:hypothetical protein